MPPVPGGVSAMQPTANALKVFATRSTAKSLLRRQSLISSTIEQADENLFYNIRYNTNHSLHYLLPKQTERSYSLRSRSHNFELSCIHDRNFIDRMLFKAYHTV